jgi:hypothetical protein
MFRYVSGANESASAQPRARLPSQQLAGAHYGVAAKWAPSANPKAFFDDSPVPISSAAFVGLAGLFAGAVSACVNL